MLFAGLAASAAIDLLSLLQQPEKSSAKSGTGATAQSTFKVADQDSGAGATAQSQSTGSTTRSEGLSRDALDTLLSAQGQEQAQRKKRSLSVLLQLMQSSQDGKVKKSDFEAAAGDNTGDASDVFDRMDQNHDSTVNVNELSSFLDSYRRASEASAQGRSRTLAMVA
jgi:hypothetical protein